MAAHQSRCGRNEVPFGLCRCRYVLNADAHLVEDFLHLVEEGYLHVALAVFHQFAGLCHPDTWRLVGAVGKYRSIETVDNRGCLRGRTAGYLHDVLDGVHRVTRIDALW